MMKMYVLYIEEKIQIKPYIDQYRKEGYFYSMLITTMQWIVLINSIFSLKSTFGFSK